MEYKLIIIPLIIVIVTQILKLSIDKIKGNMNLKNIFISYGGMPSAHTAFACSITTLAGLHAGLNSIEFALAAVFTVLIMRDAVTFRNFLGQQGALLNTLVMKLNMKDQKNTPVFMERVGHSISEVAAGAIWGITSSYILYFFL